MIQRIGILCRAGDRSILEAAELIALTLDDRNLAEIMAETHYSRDKVYRMYRAGRMIVAIKQAESCNIATLTGLTYSHWEAVSGPYKRELLTLAQVCEWLHQAIVEGWSVEALRSKLPSIPANEPSYLEKIKQAVLDFPKRFLFAPFDGLRTQEQMDAAADFRYYLKQAHSCALRLIEMCEAE